MEPQQQQQPAQQPTQSGTPGAPAAAPVESRGWYIAKIVLGSAALVFSIILVGLAAGSWVFYYGSELFWTVPIAAISIGWLVAEFITLCVRRHRKGIHPGAHVGMHLIIWLGFLACVILNAFSAYYFTRYYSSYYYGYSSGSAARQRYRSMVQAVLAFSVLQLILHFTLFVRACVETNMRNRTRSNVQYIYVQQPMYYAPQPGMQQQQQPPMGYAPQQQQQMAPGMQPAHYSGQWNGYYAPSGQQQQMHGATVKNVQNHTTGQSDPSSLSVSQNGNAPGVEAPTAVYGGQGQHAA